MVYFHTRKLLQTKPNIFIFHSTHQLLEILKKVTNFNFIISFSPKSLSTIIIEAIQLLNILHTLSPYN